jgi:hypothetical membrane protein
MKALQTAQASAQSAVVESPGERISPRIAPLAWAGIIGPVVFTASYLVQEALRRGEYSPIAEPVSALEAGPNGWVQQVTFFVFGILTMAFAIGLHRGLRPTRPGTVGPVMLFVSGIGLILAAVFPLREDAAGVTYDPGGHIVAGLMFFMTSSVGLIVLSRGLARDPRWRSIANYVLAAGAVALAGFVAMGALVMPDDAALHDWAGLGQRLLILVVLFPCRIVLSLRLLQVATGRR